MHGAPHRENSELSLKRVEREQTEEEAGSHRGLSTTEPSEEGSGSFFFALAERAIFAPVALGMGLGMERSSLLLGGASSVPEAGVACLDGRDYCQASPSALKPPVDLSVSCLVVALAEFAGVLESAFVGEALDERIDGLAQLAECFQGDSPHCVLFSRAQRGN